MDKIKRIIRDIEDEHIFEMHDFIVSDDIILDDIEDYYFDENDPFFNENIFEDKGVIRHTKNKDIS